MANIENVLCVCVLIRFVQQTQIATSVSVTTFQYFGFAIDITNHRRRLLLPNKHIYIQQTYTKHTNTCTVYFSLCSYNKRKMFCVIFDRLERSIYIKGINIHKLLHTSTYTTHISNGKRSQQRTVEYPDKINIYSSILHLSFSA